jgi:antitoxin component YwqK of YwqJK toxin-antitoxin module
MQNSGIVRIYHKEDCKKYWCDCNKLEGMQLKKEYFQNNGKIEGIYKEYNYNNILVQEINYIDGKRNGICKIYNDNGNLIEEYNYIDNIKNGICKIYNDNGNLRDEYNYIDNKLNGIHKKYYSNGFLEKECDYVNGHIKLFICYDNNNVCKKIKFFDNYGNIKIDLDLDRDNSCELYLIRKILDKYCPF